MAEYDVTIRRGSGWCGNPSTSARPPHGVRGHRQVTDAYLMDLAPEHADSVLATMDEGLVRSQPDDTVLVPPLR